MRLVHLSDLHLGYRQYQRLTPGGINQREADVATTFRMAIDRVIDLTPDVVIFAGDIFHSVRPTNQAILHAFIQFSRLAQSLPNAVIILVAGNHDTPRTSETGGILQLFTQLGLHVVDREPQRVSFFDGRLSVLAVPDVPGLVRPSFEPDRNAEFNVLAIHGEVQGMLPDSFTAADRAAVEITKEEIGAARWDYVALGHYHVYREIEPNVFYSGSIDYTSANPWGELYEQNQTGVKGKGFIERDLVTGSHTFHELPASRPLVDLKRISATGLTVGDIDQKIRAGIDAYRPGIDDKIVRLVVTDIPRHVARELDHKAIRDYKRRALNFHLDLRRPELTRTSVSGGPGGRRPSLNEIVREKLMQRPLDPEIDREALIARAMAYLDEAQAAPIPSPALAEV
jgi:DNA repair exonuclease SbcCD nuclease subunit